MDPVPTLTIAGDCLLCGDERTRLTLSERQLLRWFAAAPDAAHAQLTLLRVYQDDPRATDDGTNFASLRNMLRRLRDKLRRLVNDEKFDPIRSEYGRGYRWKTKIATLVDKTEAVRESHMKRLVDAVVNAR